jgi:hypothetical protein
VLPVVVAGVCSVMHATRTNRACVQVGFYYPVAWFYFIFLTILLLYANNDVRSRVIGCACAVIARTVTSFGARRSMVASGHRLVVRACCDLHHGHRYSIAKLFLTESFPMSTRCASVQSHTQ